MLKIPHIFILFICFLGLTSGQESFEFLNLHGSSHGGFPVAVPVRDNEIVEISSSFLKAEAWVRTHVLAHFPSTKITTILVGESDFFCKKEQEHNLGLVLLSLKNVYHSLKSWGLENDIKVSTFLGLDCLREGFLGEKFINPLLEFLESTNSSFSVHVPHFYGESLSLLSSKQDLVKKFESFELGKFNVQDLMKKFESLESMKINEHDFIKKFESFVSRKINVQDLMEKFESLESRKKNEHDLMAKFESLESRKINEHDLMEKFESLESRKINEHDLMKKESRKINVQDFMKKFESFESRKINVQDFMKKFHPFEFKKINFIISTPNEMKTMSRKLIEQPSSSSIHSSIGFSQPAHIAKSPHPSNPPTITQPPLSLPIDSPPPPLAPAFAPSNPPFGFSLPPCNPRNAPAPTPTPYMGAVQKSWCVAKPSVPAETLQEAIDYACGDGGGDCQEIMPNGRCYNPDTIVAHASYAFNSYWQKNKRNGGTCSFGALL